MMIGIDFDNTIAVYDRLIHQIAVEKGLIPASFPKEKKAIRDHLRNQPSGDDRWQEVQALIYGPRIHEAELSPGVAEFIQEARSGGHGVIVVSHKTQHSAFDPKKTDLRKAALGWLKKKGLLGEAFIQEVSFADTRAEKIEIIQDISCDVFIDDLQEVFKEPGFPDKTIKILYDPHSKEKEPPGVFLADSWKKIAALCRGLA